jgi:hypothetical protein
MSSLGKIVKIGIIFLVILGTLLVASTLLQNFLVDEGYAVDVEIIESTDYRIVNGDYFNMTETTLASCPVLKEMVMKLLSNGKTGISIVQETTKDEWECINSLFRSMSHEEYGILEIFYYKEHFFSVRFMIV